VVHTPSDQRWHRAAEETSNATSNEASNTAGVDAEKLATSANPSNETSNSDPHDFCMDLHVAIPGRRRRRFAGSMHPNVTRTAALRFVPSVGTAESSSPVTEAKGEP